MTSFRSYKTELDLNNKQRCHFVNYANDIRMVYNWALQLKLAAYKDNTPIPDVNELQREFAQLKKIENNENNPYNELSPSSIRQAVYDADSAFSNFLRRGNLKENGRFTEEMLSPSVKSKLSDGFSYSFKLSGSIQVTENSINLPYLGQLRLKEKGYLIINNTQFLSANISQQAGHWFVSISVLDQSQSQQALENIGEIEGNQKETESKSSSTTFESSSSDNLTALQRNIKKMERAQKQLGRRAEGSKNWEKQLLKLEKIKYRQSNIQKRQQ